MHYKSKFLSVRDVCKYLSLSERTIQRLSQQGKIKGIKMGGQWRYFEKDIEGYLLCGIDLSKEPARKPDNSVERRNFPRVNCFLPCSLNVTVPQVKEIYTEGRIINISEGGVFLENCDDKKISLDIKNDDPIGLKFALDGSHILEMKGRVVRMQDNGIAVKFRDITQDARERIGQYIG